MVRVAIQQPTYLPWMGYLEQIAQSDVFVFLDTVQLERQSWQTRNRLRTVAGQPFWMTVPIERVSLDNAIIRDIKICPRNVNWSRKHLAAIQASLGAAPFFKRLFPIFEYWLRSETSLLADLNIALISEISRLLGLHPTFVRSSDLGVSGAKSDLVLNICRKLGASLYYSAVGSSDYLDPEAFRQNGIELVFQKWSHPIYKQVGAEFVSHLSILDALMNVGPDQTVNFIRGASSS